MILSKKNPYISVCIPTYEMGGKGAQFLAQSFDILVAQTFQDFDVVISDHSTDSSIKHVCDSYSDRLCITYLPNKHLRGNSSANLNHAIRHATGSLIKILFQDDFLYDTEALAYTVEAFDITHDEWLVSACEHTKDGTTFIRPFFPTYNRKIHLGNNTISSPSVVTIKNMHPLLFDEQLIWLMDCDYYKRCRRTFGKPKILNTITVVNRIGEHQVSNTRVTETLKHNETTYLKNKFDTYQPEPIDLSTVTLVAVSSIKIKETIAALTYSMDNITYGEVILISDTEPENLDKRITFKQCAPLKSIDAYSHFMLYDLDRYITTPHALVVQYDGYVIRPKEWDRHFLKYDYIGAPWPKDTHYSPDGTEIRVGNGGFSLRSKKLLGILTTLELPFTDNGTGYFNEDGVLCNYYRKNLEDAGVIFAPVSVASRFSREALCTDSVPRHFGFHKNKKLLPFLFALKFALKKYFTRHV